MSYDDATIIEAIKEAELVHREEDARRRWWNEYRYVVKVAGIYIEFKDAEATGDQSAEEMGYEFDPSTIREVRPVEKTVIMYEPTT